MGGNFLGEQGKKVQVVRDGPADKGQVLVADLDGDSLPLLRFREDQLSALAHEHNPGGYVIDFLQAIGDAEPVIHVARASHNDHGSISALGRVKKPGDGPGHGSVPQGLSKYDPRKALSLEGFVDPQTESEEPLVVKVHLLESLGELLSFRR